MLRSSGMIDMGPEGYRGESGDSVDLPPWSDAALVVGEAVMLGRGAWLEGRWSAAV